MGPTDGEQLSASTTIGYAVAVVLVVLGSGLMAGLTLGYLSLGQWLGAGCPWLDACWCAVYALTRHCFAGTTTHDLADELDLEVLKRTGTAKEKRQAAKVLPLIKNPHWLLCTLVLCNAGCMETLPIFLDRLLSPVAAILISVTAILIFGEITPQAVCNKHGVAIGAFFAPVTTVLLWVCSPIAWPLGRLLDHVLGHEKPVFKRKELKAMIDLHGETAGMGGNLSVDEVNVISGALELTTKTARRSMTPMNKVFMISDQARLDDALVAQLLQMGHSRVPVYRGDDRNDIIGLILIKELLQFWRCQELPTVADLRMRALPKIPVDTPMFDVLNLFQTGRSHMVVCMSSGAPAASAPDTSMQDGHIGPMAPHPGSGTIPGMMVHPDHLAITLHDTAVAAELQSMQQLKVPNGTDIEAKGSGTHANGGGMLSHGGGSGGAGSLSPGREQNGGSGFFGRLMKRSAELSKSYKEKRRSSEEEEDVDTPTSQLLEDHESSDAFAAPPEPPGPPRPMGILTLEDVIEELMQEEIVDETDRWVDNEKTERVDMKAMVQELSPRVRKLLQAHVIEAAQLLARHSNPRPQEPLTAAARALGAELLPGGDGQRPHTAGAKPYRASAQDIPALALGPISADGVGGKASKRELRKVASYDTNLGHAKWGANEPGTSPSGPSNTLLQVVRSGELPVAAHAGGVGGGQADVLLLDVDAMTPTAPSAAVVVPAAQAPPQQQSSVLPVAHQQQASRSNLGPVVKGGPGKPA